MLVASSIVVCNNNQSKIVGLLTVRNEQLFITQCLKALSRYTDAIVLLDDCSDDDTYKIVQSLTQECNIEKILRKLSWYRDEPGDKNALLNAARAIGGTHFIFIDADEMLTANCASQDFLRKKILELKPGQKMHLNFFNLWRSVNQYRNDSSVWKPRLIDCIFCDDGVCSYKNEGFIHTSHIPRNLKGKLVILANPNYGLMHFQFVNWRNLLIKQAWYRCLEKVRYPNKSVREINNLYAPSKNEQGIQTSPVPSTWFLGYDFFDPATLQIAEQWREKQVLEWFEEFGKEFFTDLDIWDIDWGRTLNS